MKDAAWNISKVELEPREDGRGNVSVTCTNAGDARLSVAIPLVGERGFRLVRQEIPASRDAKSYLFQTPFLLDDLKTGTVKLSDQNRILRDEADISPLRSSAPPQTLPSRRSEAEDSAELAANLSYGSIKVFDRVADRTGNHDLLLKLVEVHHPGMVNRQAYDFHSLVWESREDTSTEMAILSQADFQHGCERRRWVSRIHALDPSTGRAIIQVGECWPGTAPIVEHAVYSWRE